MTAVMASTSMDKSKMDLAGVDSGAKTFERRPEEGSAAAAVAMHHTRNVIFRDALKVIDLFACLIVLDRACTSGLLIGLLCSFAIANPCTMQGHQKGTHHEIEAIFRDAFGLCGC
jgi:hypothetical protein